MNSLVVRANSFKGEKKGRVRTRTRFHVVLDRTLILMPWTVRVRACVCAGRDSFLSCFVFKIVH